jgi:thymidylate synthase (FAD)
MTAKLISYSQNENGDSLLDQIAYAARVSNPNNQNNKDTAEKLVRYLIKEGHWSPLEMVSATLEIETTRDIARQILRHRSFSFQEFSQRYADPTKDLDFVYREARLQDPKNRQNSVEVDDIDLQRDWDRAQRRIAHLSKKEYVWAIKKGIAKEQARAVLPEGIMSSRIYMNGTLRSWVHYISLRSGNGTQKEHMDVARECANALSSVFPMINEFLEDA